MDRKVTVYEHTVIRKNLLFANLTDEEFSYALQFFRAQIKEYKKGDTLSGIGCHLPAFGMVLAGNVQVFMDDIDGQPIMMANVNVSDTFGESLCFLQREAPVYILASTDAVVLWLKTDSLKQAEAMRDASAVQLSNRFIRLLSMRALSMNDRVQVLSKLSLKDKLITFFSQQKLLYGSDTFTISMNRNDMAAYLGTDRSALSRELSRLSKEGILEYRKNVFTLHMHE